MTLESETPTPPSLMSIVAAHVPLFCTKTKKSYFLIKLQLITQQETLKEHHL